MILFILGMKDYEEYITYVSLHGNWGDKITLQALSDFFGVVINVITSARYDAYLQCIHFLVFFIFYFCWFLL